MIRVDDNGNVELSYHRDMAEFGDLENLQFAVESYAHLVERNRNVSFHKWTKLIRRHAGETLHTAEISETLARCAVVRSFDIQLEVNNKGEVVEYPIPNVVAETIEQALLKVNGIDDYYPITRVLKITATPWDQEFTAKLHSSISSKGEAGDVQG